MNSAYFYEFLGTFILILMGNGVVANSILKQTKSEGAGWVNITFGWALGVFMGITIAGPHSGAHLNPAVTIGVAAAGLFNWNLVLGYILSQLAGAFTGAVTVYFYFKQHYNKTDDLDLQFATFSTSPAIRNFRSNLFSEVVGAFVLLLLVFFIAGPSFEGDNIGKVAIGLGSIGALPITLVVLGIGMSLGGTTGYAINPARDLGPRIAYAILPFHKKRSADWSYSWIPIVGPIIGAILAAALFMFSNTL